MHRLSFAWSWNYSLCAVVALGAFATSACGTEADNSGGGGAASQAGSAGTATVAGTSSGAGAATGGSGSGTAGSFSGSAGANATGGSAAGGSSATGGTAGTTTGGAAAGGSAGAAGSAGTGGTVDPGSLDKFSFFVSSMAGMRKLAKSDDGFGGDLTYGTGDGLLGADKICAELAETSMPGASSKQWRAFLSTKKGPVHAKDRIGPGPWYDRLGRVVAMDLASLLKNRPDADAAIKEDLPNEFGIGNHRPNPNAPADDNHHTLTGSNTDGTLYTAEGNMATCLDWTSKSRENGNTGTGTGRPRIGFSWSVSNRTNWISGQTEGGCGAGVTGVGETNGGSNPNNPIVGSGGGYGAIYCFALVP